MKVLDVGCGTGMFWKVLGNKVKQEFVPECILNITVSLVDISDLFIALTLLPKHFVAVKEKFQTSLENVHLSVSADQSFDIICSLHLLSNVEPRKIHIYFLRKCSQALERQWSILELTTSTWFILL